MQLRLHGLIASLGLGLSLGLSILPAQAQSESQVSRLVEALRQASPQTGTTNDGLYSDWQVKADNIPRWSKSCIGRELSPTQFEASPSTARTIIACVMRDVLRDEYKASNNNETLAVRRAAAWWMTGDPNRYGSGDIATYTQRVLSLYQQGRPTPTPTATPAPARPQTSPSQTPPPQARSQNTIYDRYMQAGYEATQKRDYQTALLYFRRATDERPNDTYAQQAIRNVEAYLQRNPNNPPSSSPSSNRPAANTNASINQQQAIALVTRWLQTKPQIFGPPFNQQQIAALTAGELYSSLLSSNGVISWLQNNQAYYRYGVQKVDGVERFASSNNKATLEVKVTEDRTLYVNGDIDPRQTGFAAEQIRYSLEWVNGNWKITDYKTVDGSLLERAIADGSATRSR